MEKINLKPDTLLYPAPAVLVSCGNNSDNNIITLAWTGVVCSEPPMLYISVRPGRYSFEMIKNTGDFVVNLPTENLAYAVDFCGVKSGRDVDKFKHLGLTPEKSSKILSPYIKEAPLSLECKIKNTLTLGSHHMFIADIVGVIANKDLLDEKGKLRLSKANLICCSQNEYWSLNKCLGFFGFSLK